MTDDERAIRDLVDTWVEATKAGDTATVLELIDDEAVFMVQGGGMFGKEAFEASSEAMSDIKMDGRADIREIEVLGDRAWIRNFIEIVMTPARGETVRRSGYALTIFRKGGDGRWRLFRDANFVN
jgi:uncharacterized protein (TIGR02246 family)